jgi:hypothetical protein
METVTLKTSTIFVAVGQRTNVYRSLDDMPESLRRKVVQTTSGSNSATILIADRRGKDELVRAIQGLPSSIPLRVTAEARRKRERREKMDRIKAKRYWLEIILIGLLAVLLWALAIWK